MDKKDFKDFLESVAVIKELKPVTTGFRLDENSGGEVRYNDEWIEVGKQGNPTLGYKFVKLKEQHRLCELGCGKVVSNQVIEKRLATHPKHHWRTRCTNCECFVSPDGVGLIKGGHQIQAAFMRWFKGKPIHTEELQQPLDITVNETKIYERTEPSKWTVDSDGNISKKDDIA